MCGWCDDVISIFEDGDIGVGNACLFRTGHRVSADEVVIETECGNCLVNLGFGASDIGDDAVLADDRF